MWLIEGPFDGNSGSVDHKSELTLDVLVPRTHRASETKLLKCGRSYLLGRKAKVVTQLVIAHPKISAQHVSFTVGPHSIDNAVC